MNKWVLALALASGLWGIANADEGDHGQHGDRIQGVWKMEVTLRSCATGAALFEPFQAVNTFHEGGTMSEHGSRFSPATRNSGQGVWKQVGRNRYTSRFLFQRFDVNGFFVGTQEVSRRMALSNDGDTMEVTAKVKIIDALGVVLTEGCSTEIGHRF
jgi:hypothetical protein